MKLLILLVLLLSSCSPKVTPEPKPGKPRYQSQSTIELNKWIEEEWPKPKADTFNINGWILIIPEEKI